MDNVPDWIRREAFNRARWRSYDVFIEKLPFNKTLKALVDAIKQLADAGLIREPVPLELQAARRAVAETRPHQKRIVMSGEWDGTSLIKNRLLAIEKYKELINDASA